MRPLLSITLGLLLLTNAFWIYHAFDTAITLDHIKSSLHDNQRALTQALAIIKASSPTASRETILSAANLPSDPTSHSFEKDGYHWIDRLGLKFSPEGQLLEAIPAWQ